MPKRKRYSYKRRSRKKRSRRRSARISRVPAGMLGKKFGHAFRYVDRIVLNPGTGTTAFHTFRFNDLYDPDYTSGGHQPIGFDQLMVWYNHFTVLGGKLKATFVSRSSGEVTGNAIVGIQITSGPNPTILANDIYEEGKSKSAIMMNSYSSGKKTITSKCSFSKFLGQKVLQEDNNAGTISASPNEIVYVHVWATGVNAGDDPFGIDVLVELDQYAVLHEPTTIGGS